jgi:F-type H+-transporting ATPase subunit epsilon
MAHTKFRVEVLTPEGQVFDDEVEQVSTMTAVGSIGILAGHQPLLGMAEPSPLRLYRSETDVVTFAQGEGYIQVADGNVLILVEEAVDPSELNAGELRDQIKEADARLAAAPEDSEGYRLATRDKRRWEAFLEIASA